MNTEKTIQFHSGSSYDEIMKVINDNIGKTIMFHYELNGYDTWGYDEEKKIILNEDGIKWIKEYMGTKEQYRKGTNDSYVHSVKIFKCN